MSQALVYAANVLLGAFLVLVGLVVARRSPDATARRFLSLYLGFVGAGYLLEGLAVSLHPTLPGVTESLRYLAVGAFILDPAFLLLAAVPPGGPRATARTAALASPWIVLLALYVLAPPETPFMRGWEYRSLYLTSLGVAYLTALGVLLARYVRATRPADLDRLGFLSLCGALIVLPRIPLLYVDFGLHVNAGRLSPPDFLPLAGGLALLSLVTAAVAYTAAAPSVRPHVRLTLRKGGLLLGLVALLWAGCFFPALTEATFSLAYAGRWFILAAVIGLGLRSHAFLDLRDHERAPLGTLLGALLVALAVIESAALLSKVPGVAVATALLSATLVVALSLATVTVYRAIVPGRAVEDQMRRRALYRAHVALGDPREALEELRRTLGLTVTEAREIESLSTLAQGVPERAPSPLFPGGVLNGRYEVTAPLGAGAFGRTYRARDRLTGQQVVLKEILPAWRGDPAAAEAFRQEARALLTVQSPTLVAFHALEPVPGGHVLVMDHVPGETLRARLARGPLAPTEGAALARDLLNALATLHRAGIVHRDVKPENIVLRPDGRAILLDLGAAVRRSPNGTRPAGAPAAQGTPGYSAPEQADPGAPVLPAADVYAAAATVWEALAGQRHPHGTLPPGWREALLRALAEPPTARYPDAASLRDALPLAANPPRAIAPE